MNKPKKDKLSVGSFDAETKKWTSETQETSQDAQQLQNQLSKAQDVLERVNDSRLQTEADLKTVSDALQIKQDKEKIQSIQLADKLAKDSQGFLNYHVIKHLPYSYLQNIQSVFESDANSFYHDLFLERIKKENVDGLTAGSWNAETKQWTGDTVAAKTKADGLPPLPKRHQLTAGRWNAETKQWEN